MVRQWFGSSAHARGAAKRKSDSLLVLLWVLAISSAWGAVPSPDPSPTPTQSLADLHAYNVEWRTPEASVRVGDTVELKVVGLDLGENLTLQPPSGSESEVDRGWGILPRAKSPQVPQGEYWFAIAPIKPGDLSIPSMVIVDSEGKALARTHPFTLKVASSIQSNDPKPTEMEEAKPPVRLQFPWWVLILAGILILLLLAGFVYLLYRWSKKNRPIQAAQKPVEPPKPEDEVALAALMDLEKKGLFIKGHFKAHYFGVSEILKNYLGARYGFDAPESTSFEILRYLESQKAVGDQVLDKLETEFNLLDRVKFTDFVPDADEASRLLQDARQLVLTTRKEVQPNAPQ